MTQKQIDRLKKATKRLLKTQLEAPEQRYIRLKKATKRLLKTLPPEMPQTLEARRQFRALEKFERGMKSFKGRV